MTKTWHTETERQQFNNAVQQVLAMNESDSSGSDNDFMSDESDDISISSISSDDDSIGETMVQVLNDGRRFFEQVNDDNPPHFVNQPDLLIDDLPDSDATTLEFRFRKADLKLICKLLWPRLTEFLVGTYNKIYLPHRHYVKFETGILMLLYRLVFPFFVASVVVFPFFLGRLLDSTLSKNKPAVLELPESDNSAAIDSAKLAFLLTTASIISSIAEASSSPTVSEIAAATTSGSVASSMISFINKKILQRCTEKTKSIHLLTSLQKRRCVIMKKKCFCCYTNMGIVN